MPTDPIKVNINVDTINFTEALRHAQFATALAEDECHTYAENITRIVREFRAAQADGTFTLPMGRYFNLRVIAAGDRAGIDRDAVSADYQDELNATAF